MKRLFCRLTLLLPSAHHAQVFANKLLPLIDAAELPTIGSSWTNTGIQKCVYWLTMAQETREKPDKVAADAVAQAGYAKDVPALAKAGLLRNLDIAC